MKKNLITLVAGIAIISGGIATTAFADNHGDSTWKNQYRWWDQLDHTPARVKTNTTYIYNKTNSISGGQYINVWAALADGSDASGGNKHHQRSYANGKANWLWNNAVENHGSGVKVRVNSQAAINGSASGVWSPDSI